jgi:hypothetical protein
MSLIYDPPGGWKFGFPRPYEPLEGEPLAETLVRDGYPAEEAEFGAKHTRFIGDYDELCALSYKEKAEDDDESGTTEGD